MNRNLGIAALLIVTLFVSLACQAIFPSTAPTSAPQEPTASSIPPQEASTAIPPSPAPTAEATPTPTILPSPTTPSVPTPIPASQSPITIGSVELQFISAALGDTYKGLAPSGMAAGDQVLAVEIEILSGDMDTLTQLEKWVTDEAGRERKVGAGLATSSQLTWLFAVPKSSSEFVLHFSSGEAIDLAPLFP